MTPDSTLAVTNTCPKDGVHLYRHLCMQEAENRLSRRPLRSWLGESHSDS